MNLPLRMESGCDTLRWPLDVHLKTSVLSATVETNMNAIARAWKNLSRIPSGIAIPQRRFDLRQQVYSVNLGIYSLGVTTVGVTEPGGVTWIQNAIAQLEEISNKRLESVFSTLRLYSRHKLHRVHFCSLHFALTWSGTLADGVKDLSRRRWIPNDDSMWFKIDNIWYRYIYIYIVDRIDAWYTSVRIWFNYLIDLAYMCKWYMHQNFDPQSK